MIEEDKLNALELFGENEYLHKEIERLTAESTEWESKFYDEADKVDKAIKCIRKRIKDSEEFSWVEMKTKDYIQEEQELLDTLKGEDK